jgi:TetR/AcrR family transcriptional repressor of nem operon
MSRKGSETREKILDAAQALILDHGFSGVSVENVIERLGMTKGAFFHHFRNKAALAEELIRRYADMDMRFFHDSFSRAEKFSSDPLQQVLIVIGLYEEFFEGMSTPYPGCLLASYIYELQQFDESTRVIINGVFLAWREKLTGQFMRAADRHPMREDVDLPSLGDEFIILIEGAFILAKSLNDPSIVAEQLRHYKRYIKMVFT